MQIFKEANNEKSLGEIKKNETLLLADMMKLQNDIFFVDEEIDKLPTKIPFDQAHDGESLVNYHLQSRWLRDVPKRG